MLSVVITFDLDIPFAVGNLTQRKTLITNFKVQLFCCRRRYIDFFICYSVLFSLLDRTSWLVILLGDHLYIWKIKKVYEITFSLCLKTNCLRSSIGKEVNSCCKRSKSFYDDNGSTASLLATCLINDIC